MSNSAEKPEVVQLPAETPAAAPVNTRRVAAQRVREARDRLTSTSWTRPAFDTELLRQYAQTRMSASYVVMLLVVATGILFGFWMQPLSAVAWTSGILCIHAVIIRNCARFLAEPASLHQVPIEATQARQPSGHGPHRAARVQSRAQETQHIATLCLEHTQPFTAQPVGIAHEIAAIGGEGIVGQPALQPHGIQKPLYEPEVFGGRRF